MAKKEIKTRWLEPQVTDSVNKILAYFKSGGDCPKDISPFGMFEGRVDLRGLEMPSCFEMKGCHLNGVDLSEFVMESAWVEGCFFKDVLFNRAKMTGTGNHGNKYFNCSFFRTDLIGVRFGYNGTSYRNCIFEKAKFRRGSGIRAEFDDCIFRECQFNTIDFGATSFVNCEFIGKVEGVWFRGGFALPEDIKDFGVPRKNRMENVSFKEASIWNVTISNSCDLSTIIMPQEGNYRLYSNWKKRLLILKEKAETLLETQRKEALVFAEVYLVHAKTQDWQIVNCDEVKQEYGEDVGDFIIKVLDSVS